MFNGKIGDKNAMSASSDKDFAVKIVAKMKREN